MHDDRFLNEDSSEGEEQISDVWKPNELISKYAASNSADEKTKIVNEILERFLDTRRPMVTGRMKDFLRDIETIRALMNYVVRIDTRGKSTLAPGQTRPIDKEESIIRRSYNVGELFVNVSPEMETLIEEKLDDFMGELFKIFTTQSRGNFFDFVKIIDQLLTRYPVETTKVLVEKQLIFHMLDYLHEPAVVDALMAVFLTEFSKQTEHATFYRSLVEAKIFDLLGERIYGSNSHTAMPASEFFVKLIDRLATNKMSGVLFVGICRTPTFVTSLFNVITSPPKKYKDEQRSAAALALRELLIKSGEKMFDQMDLKPVLNMLTAIYDKLHEYAVPYVPSICQVLIASNEAPPGPAVPFSSYTVKRLFGMYRLTLMEILSDICVAIPEIIDKMPTEVWSVLSDWFLEYPNNNLYHCMFYRIVDKIVKRDDCLNAQRALFTTYHFLGRVLQHYQQFPKSALVGHILDLVNTLRLQAALQPSGAYLRSYMNSHVLYKQMSDKLREVTLIQARKYADLDLMEDSEDEAKPIPKDEEVSIDLGSAYAKKLGFDREAPPPQPEQPVEKKPLSGAKQRRQERRQVLAQQKKENPEAYAKAQQARQQQLQQQQAQQQAQQQQQQSQSPSSKKKNNNNNKNKKQQNGQSNAGQNNNNNNANNNNKAPVNQNIKHPQPQKGPAPGSPKGKLLNKQQNRTHVSSPRPGAMNNKNQEGHTRTPPPSRLAPKAPNNNQNNNNNNNNPLANLQAKLSDADKPHPEDSKASWWTDLQSDLGVGKEEN